MASSSTEEDGLLTSSIHTHYISHPPSCIAISPRLRNVLVIGTYSLAEQEDENGKRDESEVQSRTGSLMLFQVTTDTKLALLESSTTTSAVLDLQFSPSKPDLLATAISTGAIILSTLSQIGDSLPTISIFQAFDPTILVLSLAWNPQPDSQDILAMSLSSGEVAVARCSGTDGESHTQQVFKAHSLECWTINWSSNGSRIISGGDDSVLRQWDPTLSHDHDEEEKLPADVEFEKYLRQGPPADVPHGALTDTKTHGAGVTAILPLVDDGATNTEVIVTGSYDEYIRVLVPKAGRTWVTLAEKRLGGGVWRLKLLQSVSKDGEFRASVLASCMHAGPKVLVISRNTTTWSIEAVARCEDHTSMNYASDAIADAAGYTIVSTSFYDRRLCTWHCPERYELGTPAMV